MLGKAELRLVSVKRPAAKLALGLGVWAARARSNARASPPESAGKLGSMRVWLRRRWAFGSLSRVESVRHNDKSEAGWLRLG